MKKNRFGKILSFLLSITMVLSVLIIVPTQYVVEAEAASNPLHSMYQGTNIFTAEELSKLILATNEMSVSLDNTEQALKLTLTAFNDPYCWLNFSSASLDMATYPYVVIIYKLPTSNMHDWPRIQLFWVDSSNNVKNSGDYDTNCAWYKCGAYYYDVRPNLQTSGTLSSFRIDPMTWAAFWQAGDTIYIDSIAFFTSEAEARQYRLERQAVRGSDSEYAYEMPCNAMTAQYAFTDAHNVNVSYDSYNNAFKITTANNCSTLGSSSFTDSCPNGGGKYRCWNATASGLTDDVYQTVLDPTVNLNCNVDTSKYKYIVISYMLPHNADATVLAGAGLATKATAIFDSRTGEGTRNYASITPKFYSGTSASSYDVSSTYQFGGNGYYYTQVIDISKANGDALTGFRIDPVEYTFSKLGISLYIKNILFATDAASAMSSAESMLASMTGYSSFQLSVSYNGNTLENTTVSNLPASNSPYKYVSRPDNDYWQFTIPSTTPTCSNSGIKFDGWATSSTGAAVVQPGGTLTVTGAKGTVTKTTLYALWHHMYGTLTISASNSANNIDANQTYLFRVSGTGLDPSIGEFSMVIALKTGESSSFYLPMGNYTVVCEDTWSWRYAVGSKSQSITLSSEGQNSTATFEFSSKNESWLNGLDDKNIS